MATQTAVVQYLRSLADKELAELFYEVARGRRTSDTAEEKRHLVLAEVAQEGETWSLEVIALADPAEYAEWLAGSPVCQSGVCGDCGTQVRSWAKHMICPVCGSKAYGT